MCICECLGHYIEYLTLMVYNEANRDLLQSFQQNIVISEHNDLIVVSMSFIINIQQESPPA